MIWLGRKALIAVLIGTAGLSAVYQSVAERRDRRRFPPPGELVTVGRRRFHIWRTGPAAGPTVVTLPALGGSCLDWGRLQQALGPDVALCLYDRGGLGWSDHGRWPRTAQVMADELHEVLAAAGVPGPYVLAGNSTGGVIARMYAARYPAEVAGLVLVDSSHPDQQQRLHELGEPDTAWSYYRFGLRRLLAWNGIRRARSRLGLGPDLHDEAASEHRADLVDAAVAEALSTRRAHGAAAELFCLPLMLAQAQEQLGHLGSVPLTVITAGDPERSARPRHLWLALQDELAALSTDSVHLVADRAGHFVHVDDPEFVADALRQMLTRIRKKGSSPERPGTSELTP